MTPHNEAKKEDIAKTVLMPGDPLRAKYIAENFLENPRLINSVRNMYGYTGTYKGKELTVFAHGMGIPSMGIYSYELYKFYDVENIIRIGSCGAYDPDLKLLDTVLVRSSYTLSTYAKTINNDDCKFVYANEHINSLLAETAKEMNLNLPLVNCFCTDVFDKYVVNLDHLFENLPRDLTLQVAEMETFALFYNANLLNKNASCLLSVVDTIHSGESVSPEARQTALNDMIKLALDTAIKL
jgi:purine-nucleoside phosphorylase